MELPIIPLYDKTNTLTKQMSLFIPKGPKYFASFTYTDDKPVCYLIDKTGHKEHRYVSFREELSMGTLLYGTLISNCFVCEHVCLFKNEKVPDSMDMIKTIISMTQDSDYLGSISFKLPYMAKSSLILECSNLPYTVYGIVQKKRILILQNIICGFQIKKCEGEDIYQLYAMNDDGSYAYYSNALVNDFKTSHFLKTLFYKRRANYKSIEFSDDEAEENERNIFVGCLFIPEFKKWKPYIVKTADFLKKIQFNEKKNIEI
jgi:hypothetical protein